MRLFIAIPLPPDTHRALAAMQQRLRASAQGGRYVPTDLFHITLHFIGEHDDLQGAAAACEEAVRGIHPFLLRLGSYGSFARGGARTGFATLEGDLAELFRLHETLTSALAERGFPLGGAQKRLTPHITLARDLRHDGDVPPGMEQAAASLGAGSAFLADKLVLYESRHQRGRMEYTPLHRARLLKAGE